MKKATQCLACGLIFASSDGYRVKATVWQKNLLTGEKTLVELTGLFCPLCAQKAGYKVSKRKKKKYGFSI